MGGEQDVERDVYLDVPVDVVSPRYYREVRTLHRRRLMGRRRWRSCCRWWRRCCRRWNGRSWAKGSYRLQGRQRNLDSHNALSHHQQ
jgi:hypothetical protein